MLNQNEVIFRTNSNFADRAVLTIDATGKFMIFHTYDAIHGRSRSFYMDTDAFLAWVDHSDGKAYLEYDCQSYVRCYHSGKSEILMHFTWVYESAVYHNITGWMTQFSLSIDDIQHAVSNHTVIKRLITIDKHMEKSRIIITPRAQRQIVEMDKLRKHAIIKYLRNAFTYGRTSVITLYHDYDGAFYFQETCASGNGLDGGILLAKKQAWGKDHQHHDQYYWQTHT